MKTENLPAWIHLLNQNIADSNFYFYLSGNILYKVYESKSPNGNNHAYPVNGVEAYYDLLAAVQRNSTGLDSFFKNMPKDSLIHEYIKTMVFFWDREKGKHAQ